MMTNNTFNHDHSQCEVSASGHDLCIGPAVQKAREDHARHRAESRRRFAKRNGAPPECAAAFASTSNSKPTVGEFVDFLKTYLSK